MAKFFVGQRVRIVSAAGYPNLVGMETFIDDFDGDRYILPIKGRQGDRLRAKDHNLVPLVEDTNKSCGMSYQEMMDKLKESVNAVV